jgi:neutral ceramidase
MSRSYCLVPVLWLVAMVPLQAAEQGSGPLALLTTQNADGTLAGWKFFSEDTDAKTGEVWRLTADGVLTCKGAPQGYIYTEKEYTDFVLTLEWRTPPGKTPGRGGVLVRMSGKHKIWPKSLEAQLNAGSEGDFWGLDGYALAGPQPRLQTIQNERLGKLTNLKRTEAAVKAPGEWNRYEILADGHTVRLKINGREVNQASGCAVLSGPICLTAEGDEVHFRRVSLVPLPKDAAEETTSRTNKTLRAGAYAIDVTPQKLPVIVNGGMLEGRAADVIDPLYCRSLVLDDGTTQIVIAVVDSCVLPRPLLDEAKALAEKATGIPASHMLISATHCHSAPSVCGALGTGLDEDYAGFLPGKIAEGITSAYRNLAPARIGWGVGKDPKNVFCRRFLMKPGTASTNPFSGTKDDQAQMNPGYQNPNAIRRTGEVDDDVSIVSVQTAAGEPIALLGNYSTHYAGAPPISADYFGVFCRRIAQLIRAEKVQPPFVGIMSNGTSGDANCCDFANPPRKFDRFTVGEDVAQVACQAYQTVKYYDWVPLVVEEKLLTLGVRMPSPEEVARAKDFLAAAQSEKPRNVAEVYARETVLLSEMPPTRELKLQAVCIGPLGIAAIPNEVFGVTGLKIKRQSPLRPTINIELANGYFGYVPPPDQFPLGGYTTWRARSSCLEVQAEPKITAAVLELLGEVAQRRKDALPIASKAHTTQEGRN